MVIGEVRAQRVDWPSGCERRGCDEQADHASRCEAATVGAASGRGFQVRAAVSVAAPWSASTSRLRTGWSADRSQDSVVPDAWRSDDRLAIAEPSTVGASCTCSIQSSLEIISQLNEIPVRFDLIVTSRAR
jgi:hypothetical protein